MITTYTENVHDIALNTFEVTCFMFPMDEWEIEEEELDYPDGSTRSIVGFDGAAKGGMVINPNESLLTAIAANMLGIDVPTEEEKEGALCEIANIICGNTVPLFAKNDKNHKKSLTQMTKSELISEVRRLQNQISDFDHELIALQVTKVIDSGHTLSPIIDPSAAFAAAFVYWHPRLAHWFDMHEKQRSYWPSPPPR